MLECHGAVFEARYRNAKKNLFDGVHMLGCSGKKAYTESVLNILREAQLIKSNPPSYFRRFHQTSRSVNSNKNDSSCFSNTPLNKVYNVPTLNRFSVLQQGN